MFKHLGSGVRVANANLRTIPLKLCYFGKMISFLKLQFLICKTVTLGSTSLHHKVVQKNEKYMSNAQCRTWDLYSIKIKIIIIIIIIITRIQVYLEY